MSDDLGKRIEAINGAVDRIGKSLGRRDMARGGLDQDLIPNSAYLLKIAMITFAELSYAVGKLAMIAEADFNEAVQAEVRTRAEEMADEKVKEQSKRSFIGKKDA